MLISDGNNTIVEEKPTLLQMQCIQHLSMDSITRQKKIDCSEGWACMNHTDWDEFCMLHASYYHACYYQLPSCPATFLTGHCYHNDLSLVSLSCLAWCFGPLYLFTMVSYHSCLHHFHLCQSLPSIFMVESKFFITALSTVVPNCCNIYNSCWLDWSWGLRAIILQVIWFGCNKVLQCCLSNEFGQYFL